MTAHSARASDARVAQLLAQRGVDREFLTHEPMRPANLHGVDGVALTVRLTSYRALPLSCLAGVHLCIDGAGMDPALLRLTLCGTTYRVEELAALSSVWWFILDTARLFVPWRGAPGPHLVEGVLITVEPYITAGRFQTYSTSKKVLHLTEDLA